MYEASDELEELALDVMAENTDVCGLANPELRIVYLYSDKEKFKNGKYVFADTEKISDKVKTLVHVDFIITFYSKACEALDSEQMKILMHHELKHVGYDPDSGKCKIIPHDIEDFRDIIETHGMDWTVGAG